MPAERGYETSTGKYDSCLDLIRKLDGGLEALVEKLWLFWWCTHQSADAALLFDVEAAITASQADSFVL